MIIKIKKMKTIMVYQVKQMHYIAKQISISMKTTFVF